MRCINGEITEGDIYKVCKKEGANGAVATCYLIEIRNEQSLLNDLPNKLPKALLDQMIGLWLRTRSDKAGTRFFMTEVFLD